LRARAGGGAGPAGRYNVGVSRIHLLPDPLVSQIAAGEVVERPASVVKELIENALDAGASEIEVRLEAGGKGRIAVADDGCGMEREDALLAFDRHATSKIASFEDLERVGTLGFRGEALAAISSVSRVELTTAERPGEGYRVRIEGGRVKVAEPLARPRGTTVDVRSLFFNVPARRKFLKAPETELRRALEVVQGYALARPDVRWRVLHDDRALLDALPAAAAVSPAAAGLAPAEELPAAPATSSRAAAALPAGSPLAAAAAAAGTAAARQRIAQLFGAELAARLTPIGPIGPMGPVAPLAPMAPLAPPGPTSSTGHLRAEARSAEKGTAGELTGLPAVERIGGLLGSPETSRGRRQFVFVNRRLLRDRAVLGTFYRVVREEWKNDEYPALFLFLDLPPAELDVNVHPQKAEVRFRDPRLLERVAEALRRALGQARGEVPAPLRRPAAAAPEVPFAWQGLGGRPTLAAWRNGGGAALPADPETGSLGRGLPSLPGEIAEVGRLSAPSYAPPERAAVPLSGRHGEVRPFRLLGQYKGTLILLEGPDGLYLVDQHVAHERILYERLRRSLAASTPPSQALLTPLLLELAPAERLRLAELAPALESCGFGLSVLSGQTLALTAVPAALAAGEAEALLAALAGDSSLESADDGNGIALRVLDALAASLACKAAVKMHHPLSPPEMEALMTELFAAEQPYACPHGRPIVLQMTDSDLERRFGRR
jgi:DNA mismatch repair protein MutL